MSPVYDFKCFDCDTAVEMRVAVDSTDRPECSKCNKPMTKTFTPPAIHFKGTGWGHQ